VPGRHHKANIHSTAKSNASNNNYPLHTFDPLFQYTTSAASTQTCDSRSSLSLGLDGFLEMSLLHDLRGARGLNLLSINLGRCGVGAGCAFGQGGSCGLGDDGHVHTEAGVVSDEVSVVSKRG